MPVTAVFHTAPPSSSRGGSSARPSSTALTTYKPPPGSSSLTVTLADSRWFGNVPVHLQPEVSGELLVERVFGMFSDILAHLFSILGLRHFTHLSQVNKAWRAAVDAKYKQWGVLVPAGTLGQGHGRRRGQFDMPTHCAMLPGGHLCVVDSCNERLVLMQQDGEVLKMLGRPGANRGQLSSPSGAACNLDWKPPPPPPPPELDDDDDLVVNPHAHTVAVAKKKAAEATVAAAAPAGMQGVLYATSLIETPGAGYGGRVHAQRCILKLSLPNCEILQSSPLRPDQTLHAPEGMAVAGGRVCVPLILHAPLTPSRRLHAPGMCPAAASRPRLLGRLSTTPLNRLLGRRRPLPLEHFSPPLHRPRDPPALGIHPP